MTLSQELVLAANATYSTPASLPVRALGVYVVLSRAQDGTLIVAFRGSITLKDWLGDFLFAPQPTLKDPELGWCHQGFLNDCSSALTDVSKAVGHAPFYITGHSLGGAEAVGMAAMLAARGQIARQTTTFGAPRFGMGQFVLATKSLSICQYRYAIDPVPLVPFDVPPIAYQFTRPQTPLAGTCTNPFACHHITNYMSALNAS